MPTGKKLREETAKLVANIIKEVTAEDLYEQAERLYEINDEENISKAIDLYLDASKKDYAPACYKLGIMLLEGKYLNQDNELAIEYLEKAAKQNLPEAYYQLSLIYESEGSIVTANEKKSDSYLRKAAALKHPNAMFKLGLILESMKQDEKAFVLFKRAAEKGYTEAQAKIGSIYYNEKKLEEAADWFIEAAKQSHEESQYNLGLILNKKKDFITAASWFLKASDKGFPKADYQLGLMVFNKKLEFLNQKHNSPLYWFEKAASKGHVLAQYKIGLILQKGNETIKVNLEEAFKWYEKAASGGVVEAQYKLALAYEMGNEIIEQNPKVALKWYEIAANKGHPYSQYRMALYFEKGDVVKQDFKQALFWYEKVALTGHPNAQYMLGVYYEKGQGINANPAIAKYWYKKAIMNGTTFDRTVLNTLSPLDENLREKATKAMRQAIVNDDLEQAEANIKKGADINLIIDEKNAISLAFLYKRWEILKILLLERDAVSKFQLEALLAHVKQRYKTGTGDHGRDNRLLLDDIINTLVTNSQMQIEIAVLFEKYADRYLNHLRSRDTIYTKKASNVTTKKFGNQTGYFVVHGTRLTGWHAEYFLPMRIRIFFEILLKLELGLITEMPCDKGIIIEFLKKEILLLLECFSNHVNNHMIQNNSTDTVRKELFSLQVQNFINKVKCLGDQQECIYLSGYEGHIIYISFKRYTDSIAIRIDNLGGGCNAKGHPYEEREAKNANKQIQRYRKSMLVGLIKIDDIDHVDVKNYILDLIEAQFLPKDEGLNKIYTNIFNETCKNVTTSGWPYKKQQIVGNCVVKNAQVGLHMRLNFKINDQYNNNKFGKPKLYEWLRAQEEGMVGASIAYRRRPDLSIEVDEELLEITKSLEGYVFSSVEKDKKVITRFFDHKIIPEEESEEFFETPSNINDNTLYDLT